MPTSQSRRLRREAPVSRLRPKERVASIIEAARGMLAERGYENCTTAEIAARAGVVEGTIYRYFESKRELFVKVAEHWFEELLASRDKSPAPKDIRSRLRRSIWDALYIIRNERALSRFVLMELRPDPNYKDMPVFKLNQAYTAGVLSVLKDAAADGMVAPNLSLSLLRDMIFGAIEHQTWAFLREEGDFSADAAADAITDVIFQGMQPRIIAATDIGARVDRLEQIMLRLDASLDAGATISGKS